MLTLQSKKLFVTVTGTVWLLLSTTSFAKMINLYELPKTDSKVVATIDATSSMIPVFTNKTGDWMKVGDPKNGNVGWIKVSDAAEFTSPSGATSTSVSMSAKTIGTANGPQTYRTIQFGNPEPMTSAQTQAYLKALEQRQAAIQKYTQQVMQNLFTNINDVYKNNPNLMNQFSVPMVIPVIVVPESAIKQNSK